MEVEPCASRETMAPTLLRLYILRGLTILMSQRKLNSELWKLSEMPWDICKCLTHQAKPRGLFLSVDALGRHPSIFALQIMSWLLLSVPFSCPPVFKMIVEKSLEGTSGVYILQDGWSVISSAWKHCVRVTFCLAFCNARLPYAHTVLLIHTFHTIKGLLCFDLLKELRRHQKICNFSISRGGQKGQPSEWLWACDGQVTPDL